jgi:hypothetical protein
MTTRRWLALLLAVALGLRIWMAAGGGQEFWPDESRYGDARAAAGDLEHGRMRAALVELFVHADHVLFRAAALPVAAAELLVGGTHPVLVSCYFSLFSVGAIFLVWAVARRSGAGEREALWAAFLAACSGSLFYYSRHFLPYDVSLCAMLLALWLGLGPFSWRRSLLTGAAAGLGFLTYNGYWLLGGCVLVLHTLLGDGGVRRMPARAVAGAVGLSLPIAVLLGIGGLLSRGLVASYAGFAGTVLQGDLFHGYRFIPEYLWHAEHGELILWLAGIAAACLAALAGRAPVRLAWWLGALAFLCAGWVLFSDILPRMVVYGRLVRTLVPFACLAAALGIDLFLQSRRKGRGLWAAGLALGAAAMAAPNFATPLRQVFPRTFDTMARDAMGAPARHGYAFHRVLFSGSLWGEPLDLSLPPHAELLRRAQPMQFKPYQFEGFSGLQRAALDHHDIAMRVIEFPPLLRETAPIWGGYPGPVRLVVSFQPGPAEFGTAEPLVSTGIVGAGDLVFVRYVDSGHVAFGLSHVGSPDLVCGPVPLDLSRPHEILLSAGSLLPPPGDAPFRETPELAELCGQVVVIVDKHLVFSSRAAFHRSSPRDIFFGTNMLYFPGVARNFTGTVSDFSAAKGDDIALSVPSMAAPFLARNRPAEWRGALGPVRLRFSLAPEASGVPVGQPLVSINGRSGRQMVYVVPAGEGRVRVGLDGFSAGALLSEPLSTAPSGDNEMDIYLASLLPSAEAPIFSRMPAFARVRDTLFIKFNGAPALNARMPLEPVPVDRLTLGANTVGSTACGPYFTGRIASITMIGPENLEGVGTHLMNLLQSTAAGWGGYPGPVRIRLVFPEGRAGQSDPLLVSGSGSARDVVFVTYESDSQVRIGYQHSGSGKVVSDPLEVKPGALQELLVSTGATMPPAASPLYAQDPRLELLEGTVQVGLNGKPALFAVGAPHPSSLDGVLVGENPLGGEGISPRFQGTLVAVGRAAPLEGLEQYRLDPALARPGWGGYPGPLRMKVVFPDWTAGAGLPLVTTGQTLEGDFLFAECSPDNVGRIVQDHWGSRLVRSEPFDLSPGKEHTLVVSFGALYPPQESGAIRSDPALAMLRGRVVVFLDGRRILSEAQLSHPTEPSQIKLGANFIGGSTARMVFGGKITDVVAAPIAAVAP